MCRGADRTLRLEGKRAIVTGGGRGIGRAIAIGLAGEGADVAIFYRSRAAEADDTAAAIEKLGRRALAVRTDVSVREDVQAAVDSVLSTFAHVDVLVNNAGVVTHEDFLQVSEDNWNYVLGINLRGPFLTGQAVARHMATRRAGSIINVTSILDTVAVHSHTPYLASKGGLLALTRGMAVDLGRFGIRVNALAPGVTETDMARPSLEDPEVRSRVNSQSPLRGVGTPEDYVGPALFLASDESAFMTGERVCVDGGLIMYHPS
jgi:NAD(P)-dependent dehydrogenase (short-subunit alcohol dehydrogenase family)